MAKKNTIQGLDVSAMYQIGAAGAGAKKTQDKKGENILSQIGRYAISYYMKAADNLASARKQTSQLFYNVQSEALNADIVMPAITDLKNQLDNANKILNSPRAMLLPNSEKVLNAQKMYDEAMNKTLSLAQQFKDFAPIKDYQVQLANNSYVVNKDTDKERTVGYSSGSTAEEIYNSSLFASGILEKALYEENGKLMVDYSKIPNFVGPYGGVLGFDNPNTDEIELAPTGSIALEDMKFATHANPNQPQLAKDHMSTLTGHGMNGDTLEDITLNNYKSDLQQELQDLNESNPKAMVDYLFDKNGFIDADGNSSSLIDVLIEDDQVLSGRAAQLKANAMKEDSDGGVEITKEEMDGIREVMKLNILDGNYNVETLTNVIHEKSVNVYESALQTWQDKKDQSSNSTVSIPERIRKNEVSTWKKHSKLIDNYQTIDFSGEADVFQNSLSASDFEKAKKSLLQVKYFDGTTNTSGGNKIPKGWHLMFEKDGSYYFFNSRSLEPLYTENIIFKKDIKPKHVR